MVELKYHLAFFNIIPRPPGFGCTDQNANQEIKGCQNLFSLVWTRDQNSIVCMKVAILVVASFPYLKPILESSRPSTVFF